MMFYTTRAIIDHVFPGALTTLLGLALIHSTSYQGSKQGTERISKPMLLRKFKSDMQLFSIKCVHPITFKWSYLECQ